MKIAIYLANFFDLLLKKALQKSYLLKFQTKKNIGLKCGMSPNHGGHLLKNIPLSKTQVFFCDSLREREVRSLPRPLQVIGTIIIFSWYQKTLLGFSSGVTPFPWGPYCSFAPNMSEEYELIIAPLLLRFGREEDMVIQITWFVCL